MIIQKASLKPFTTELPAACNEIIKQMLDDSGGPEVFCHRLEILSENCGQTGKVEFSHYYEILNICDLILQSAVERSPSNNMNMTIDCTDHLDNVVISILKFTSVLFENTFFRSVYSSFSELIKLLDTIKPKILTNLLRLLVSISKTSRYIMQHTSASDQKLLSTKLMSIYECWDKCDSSTLAEYIKSDELAKAAKIQLKLTDAGQSMEVDGETLVQANARLYSYLSSIEDETNELDRITPLVQQRFNFYMNNLDTRIDSVIHCLMSMSVVFYSRCLLEEWRISSVVKDAMIEQICELVQLEPSAFDSSVSTLVDNLRTESLKTLASIVFLEKNDKLQLVIDNLGLNHYLGYAANTMRHIVRKLKTGETTTESTAFITSLLSLIYHLAGFESSGSSLVNISTVPSLLDVVSLTTLPDTLISFATRAVRIIDILTSLSYNEFNSHDGIQIVVRRLVFEVNKCREFVEQNAQTTERHFVCHHHRSALIKSLLNFLKRAVVDSSYIQHARQIMSGDLPKALLHIFQTSQYYGHSLVHCALELTTVFIYQEPAQLNTIQDSGVSKAIIKLFFSRHFPLSREIVLSLPNICSALCLNERGLVIFNEQKPLTQIFRIIFSSGFIQVLRKRKNELVSAGGQLGIHFDEFMRHQPTLRRELIFALVKILDELTEKAKNNEINVSTKPSKNVEPEQKAEQETTEQPKPVVETFEQQFTQWGSFSEDKLQDLRNEHEKSRRTHLVAEAANEKQTSFELVQDGSYLPLSDYMVLAIKMVEAILSNSTFTENSTAMIEAKLIDKLVSFFSTERIMPITSNPNYLGSLPSVFRLLLQQSRNVQTFTVLSQIFTDQIARIELPDTSSELTTQGKVAELGRLSSLVTMFFNFLRMSLTTNAQDSRAIIFQYLANDANGLKFIGEITDALQKFGKSIAHFNKEFREIISISRKNTTSQLAPQISVEISTNTTNTSSGEGTTETATSSSNPPKEESSSANPQISSAFPILSNIYKNLVEIVCQVGRSTGTPTRSRRNIPEGSYLTDSSKIAEELMKGVRTVLENVEYEGNWAFYVQNLLPMVRRLLCDESSNPYPQMLICFVKTRCHSIFFDIGDKLLEVESLNTVGTPLLGWLSTLMCFLSVESIANSHSRSSRASSRDIKEIDEYLSVVQEKAVQGVGKIFVRLIDAYDNQQDKKETDTASTAPSFDNFQLLEKVLDLFKELYQGIFFLHHKTKSIAEVPANNQVATEADNSNIELLIDMGFTDAQARQALSLYPTVDEAAEHLLATGVMAQADEAQDMAEEQQEEVQPEANAANSDPIIYVSTAENTEENPIDRTIVEHQATRVGIDFKGAVTYLCDELVPKCLTLMEKEPSIVFSVADLLRVFIYNSEIKEWAENMLIRKMFVTDLDETLKTLSDNFEQASDAQVKKFASQVHLICLLWEGFDDVYINALRECNFYNNVISVVTKIIQTEKHSSTLLAPLILWLELYKKEFCLVKRRELFNESIEGPILWQYWSNEDQHYGSSGNVRRDFSALQSAEITSAFKAGKSECKVKAGDRQYVVDFVTMTQKQNDRQTSSPVYGTVKLKSDFDVEAFMKAEQELHDSNDDSLKLVELIMQMLKSLGANSQPELVFSLVSLLHRLTLNEKSAQKFIELEGIETLVHLRCNKATTLLTTVVSLILRNCCLNERLTVFSINRLLRSLHAGTPVSSTEQTNKSLPTRYQRTIKEWRRLFRLLTPFCDQNLQMYMETTRDMISHKDMGEFQMKSTAPEQPTLEESDLNNLNRVLSVVTDELLQNIDNKTTNSERVLKPNNLLLIVAELVRSYPQSANTVLNLRHNNNLFLQILLENVILDAKQTTEMIVSSNSVFHSVMVAKNSDDCNQVMVQIVQAVLNNVIQSVATKESDLTKEEGKEFCQKLTTLTKFLSLLKDSNPTILSTDNPRRSFVHVVHEQNLLLQFIKAVRLIPLNGQQQSAGETANSVFKFFEDFSRSIGMAKADVAAREFAANNETNNQPAEANANQQADGAANAQAANNAPANNEAEPVRLEPIIPMDANPELMMDIFGESSADEQDDDTIRENQFIEFNNDPQNMEDDYEGDMHDMHGGDPDDSSSSSDDSGDADQTDAHPEDETDDHIEQHGNEQPEGEMHGDGANANLARNLEQLTNGLNNIDSALRRHQHAIRAIIENEEEPIDERDQESPDEEDIELIESTDDEVELETENENETEEEEMQPTQADSSFPLPANYDLDIEMLPNESVIGEIHSRDGGGLLQIRNGGTADARFFIPVEMQGTDLANSISLLTEYISSFYGSRRNHGANVVLNTIVRGTDSGDSIRNRNGFGSGNTLNTANRSDTLHPLLRRPSRTIPVQATVTSSSHQRASNHETLNFFLEEGGNGSPFGAGSHAFIENAINAIGAWTTRSRSHRNHATRHTHHHHHHGLRRQNALRSRPLINSTRLLTFNGPGRLLPRHFVDGHFNGPFMGDDQELITALQDPYNSFGRRTVDSYIPFMLDRVAASTRLLNAHSVHYIGMVVAAHLAEVCRQKPEPVPPQIEPPAQQQPAEDVAIEVAPLQDTERPNEDEARSVDEVSVDSSELTNRFANMEADEDATRDDDELDDGERTPQQLEDEASPQQMEVEQPIIVQEQSETSQPTETPTEAASTSETPAQQPENAEEQPGTSGLQDANEDEGIDPAFLAALPEDIRQEVIRDHQRQQRLNQIERRRREQSNSMAEAANNEGNQGAGEGANNDGNPPQPDEDAIDPEFLAALPPELQEEVLSQRQQQQAARAVAVNQNASANEPAADAIAFLDSLNPSLRAQVLADVDDTVIQILPENLAAEANRIRRDYEHDQLMRLASSGEHRNYAWRTNENAYMAADNYMNSTPASIVQIFDQESVATIALFYFFNNDKFTFSRFQRVFKVIALHPGTCDFVLRSLLSILSAACTEGPANEENQGDLKWSNSFRLHPSSSNPESILHIGKDNKIVVNKQFRSQVITRVLETLGMLARQSAVHFFNSSLRFHAKKETPASVGKPEGLEQFWKVVDKFDSSYKNVGDQEIKTLEPIGETSSVDIRECPFGLLLELSTTQMIANSPVFLEKILRTFHSVLHIPATVTHTKQEVPLCVSDDTNDFLLSRLKQLIVSVMSTQTQEDSFREFRNFLVQLLYAFPSLRYSIFVILYDIVRNQGLKLAGMLKQLKQAFEDEEKMQTDEAPKDSNEPSTSKDNTESVKELPSLKILSSKRNSPKQMLRSLNVVSYVRNQLVELYKRRRSTTDVSKHFTAEDAEREEKLLYSVLDDLDELWDALSFCLEKIGLSRAVTGLQSAAEVFFLIHSLAIQPATPVVTQPTA